MKWSGYCFLLRNSSEELDIFIRDWPNVSSILKENKREKFRNQYSIVDFLSLLYKLNHEIYIKEIIKLLKIVQNNKHSILHCKTGDIIIKNSVATDYTLEGRVNIILNAFKRAFSEK